MRCPFCRQRGRGRVVNTRKQGSIVTRRRECPCGQRYNTLEICEPRPRRGPPKKNSSDKSSVRPKQQKRANRFKYKASYRMQLALRRFERLGTILRDRQDGFTLRQIGKQLGLTRQRVQQILAESGAPDPYPGRIPSPEPIEPDLLREMVGRGWTTKRIAIETDLTIHQAAYRLIKHGIRRNKDFRKIGCPVCIEQPYARNLCHNCYCLAHTRGKLDQYPPNTKRLCPEQVLEIRRLAKKPGWDSARLARRFGSTIGNISAILARRTWQNLT